jgi:hypothetical protein
MSKKHRGGPGPVPRSNRSKMGPKFNAGPPDDVAQSGESPPSGSAPGQEQDEKRRLGSFVGAGEQSFKQPGGKNDANH